MAWQVFSICCSDLPLNTPVRATLEDKILKVLVARLTALEPVFGGL